MVQIVPLLFLATILSALSPAASLLLEQDSPLVVPLRFHQQPLPALTGGSFLSLRGGRAGSQARLLQLRSWHNNLHAIEYTGEISVGGQIFSVLFDTGSDRLAIPSSRCNTSKACRLHRLYDVSKSMTARNSSEGSLSMTELSFGMGKLRGVPRNEKICLGDACSRATFVEALEESDNPFKTSNFDGVLGLSLKLRSDASSDDSVLQALVDSKSIPRALFAVFMAKDLHSGSNEISFGAANARRMASDTTWVTLSDPGYWQFSLEGVSVGGKDLELCQAPSKAFGANVTVETFFGKMCCRNTDQFIHEERCQYHYNFSGWRSSTMSKGKVLATFGDGRLAVQHSDGCVQKVPREWLALSNGCRGDGSIQAIVDTGTSLMMAPESIVSGITSALGVKEDCSAQLGQRFPSLSLRLPGGKVLTMNQEDYMDIQEVPDDHAGTSKSYCWVHLMNSAKGTDSKGPLFVLGLPFLRAYYTTFDAELHRIGFALPRQGEKLKSSAKQAAAPSDAVRVGLRGHRPGETDK